VAGDSAGADAEIDLTASADQAGISGSNVAAELALVSAHRYEPLGELARGGGGRIVRARDLAFDRIVALKEPLDPVHGGNRLRAEAAILASLQHPSIVPIYDHGTRLDGVPFFAMKLVDGRSLREVIRDAVTLEQRLALIPQVVAVAEAVAYAHSRGVIHRDLKPANVLIGAFGETIVIDWGIAKVYGLDADTVDDHGDPAIMPPGLPVANATRTGAIIGTPAYMAPEQARGERVDARADVYALGAILYHVLAGSAPFGALPGRDVLAAVLAGPPEPIDQLQQRVPADLAAIVTKAMARDPAERYPSAAGLAEDLVRFQTGRLVAARRYSLIARARRLVRRRAGWFAAAGLAVASAVAAIALAPSSPAPEPGAQCARAGDRVRQLWTPERRQAVRAAFTATGLAHAPRIVDALLPRIDRAVDALAGANEEACAATYARGERSESQYELQMGCLGQQRARLGATLDALAAADAKIVDVASRAVGELDDPRACASVERLALVPPEPVDPDVRARLAGLRGRLAVTWTALNLRRDGDVLDELRAIAPEAERIGYCPVEVDARFQLGTALVHMQGNSTEAAAALALLRRAALDADACGDDRIRTWALLMLLDNWDSNDLVGRERLSAEAEAASRRVDDPVIEIRLWSELAETARNAGHLERAIALGERALAAAALNPKGANPAIEVNFAKALLDKGDLDRALAMAKVGAAGLRRENGDDHPMVGRAEEVLARVHMARGEHDLALAAMREGLRIQQKNYGPEHQDALKIRAKLAGMLIDLGRFADAAAQLERDRPIAERVAGPDSERTVVITEHLARAYRGLGRRDESLALARAVLATRLRTVGPEHPKTGRTRALLGEILEARGEHAAAIAELRAALAILSKAQGSASLDTATTSWSLAAALIASGKPAEAIPLLRAALAVHAKLEDRTRRGEIELALARALWDAGGDRAEARALAAAARDRAGGSAELSGRAAAWLAAHL
jgi:tetratricopeptide (TPR) repeat protein